MHTEDRCDKKSMEKTIRDVIGSKGHELMIENVNKMKKLDRKSVKHRRIILCNVG